MYSNQFFPTSALADSEQELDSIWLSGVLNVFYAKRRRHDIVTDGL